jgi:elongation factor P--(R)-beta-lysine ligase
MRLRYQFELIQLIRNYFSEQGFLDVLTPPAVENPGMEVHIHPFQLRSVQKKMDIPLYLHTSPEFCMKELLTDPDENLDKIFTINYCFRDEPISPIHRPQFLMLEWYRKNVRYEVIMDDVEGLIQYCLKYGEEKLPLRKMNWSFQRKTMQELFLECAGIDILNYLTIESIKGLCLKRPEIPVPNADLEWDDYFFLLYLNLVEPLLQKYPILLVYDFPAPLAALSTTKETDPRVCERFEVYVNGVELCNAFNELTDLKEQKKRFELQNELKLKLYNYQLPKPDKFYSCLERGLPPSAGIALGVERLLSALTLIDEPFYSLSN